MVVPEAQRGPEPPATQWPKPLPPRRQPHQGAKPSKHVYFDGPHGEEIRRRLEATRLLKGWSTSDTILHFLWKGMERDDSGK